VNAKYKTPKKKENESQYKFGIKGMTNQEAKP
jgi:hypothetical protein